MKRTDDKNATVTREIVVPSSILLSESAPHNRIGGTVRGMSLDVLLALFPTAVCAAIVFGWHFAAAAVLSVLSALLTEFLSGLLFRRPASGLDGTAAVTGLLVVLFLPASAPVWAGALGSAFAILVVKQCFGGLGCNVINPAGAAILLLRAVFPAETAWTSVPASFVLEAKSPLSLLFGVGGGPAADASALLLLAGGIFLICRRQISWEITVPYLFVSSVGMLMIPSDTDPLVSLVLLLCSGGTLLGAFFLLNDPVTSPMTQRGRVLYGVLAAVFTLLFRALGCADAVLLAVLLDNLLVWPLDRLTVRAPQTIGGRHGTN